MVTRPCSVDSLSAHEYEIYIICEKWKRRPRPISNQKKQKCQNEIEHITYKSSSHLMIFIARAHTQTLTHHHLHFSLFIFFFFSQKFRFDHLIMHRNVYRIFAGTDEQFCTKNANRWIEMMRTRRTRKRKTTKQSSKMERIGILRPILELLWNAIEMNNEQYDIEGTKEKQR